MKLNSLFVVIFAVFISSANTFADIKCTDLFVSASSALDPASKLEKQGAQFITELTSERKSLPKQVWTPEQINELVPVFAPDLESAVLAYGQILRVLEANMIEGFQNKIHLRIEKFFTATNIKKIDVNGKDFSVDLHKIYRLASGLYAETKINNPTVLQLGVLLKAQNIYQTAKEIGKEKDSYPELLSLMQQHFSKELFPDIKGVLRTILNLHIDPSSGCCGSGCDGCRFFNVMMVMENLSKAKSSSLPLWKHLQKAEQFNDQLD